MKLSDYAKKVGIHYQTAHRQFKKGLIPGAYKTDSGAIIVPNESPKAIVQIDEDKLPELELFFKERGWIVKTYKPKTIIVE